MIKPTPLGLLATASLGLEVRLDGEGKPPSRVHLFPMGRFSDRLGRTFELKDKAHATRVIAATKAFLPEGSLPFDYDHQSEFAAAPGVGGQAIASAWATDFSVDDEGIWAEGVKWTAKASAHLEAKEYRFISPTFFHSKSGELLGFKTASLTITPAFDLKAVASSHQEHVRMIELKKVAQALGLSEDADESAVIAAAIKATADAATASTATAALVATASALGLPAETDGAAIATAAASAKAANGSPDPAKFVPIGDLQAVQTSMATMKTQLDGLQSTAREKKVDAAIAAGQLVPAQRPWAISLATSNEQAFDDFLAGAPANGLTAEAVQGGKKPTGGDGLTDEERSTASMLGISAEDFIKARKDAE